MIVVQRVTIFWAVINVTGVGTHHIGNSKVYSVLYGMYSESSVIRKS